MLLRSTLTQATAILFLMFLQSACRGEDNFSAMIDLRHKEYTRVASQSIDQLGIRDFIRGLALEHFWLTDSFSKIQSTNCIPPDLVADGWENFELPKINVQVFHGRHDKIEFERVGSTVYSHSYKLNRQMSQLQFTSVLGVSDQSIATISIESTLVRDGRQKKLFSYGVFKLKKLKGSVRWVPQSWMLNSDSSLVKDDRNYWAQEQNKVPGAE